MKIEGEKATAPDPGVEADKEANGVTKKVQEGKKKPADFKSLLAEKGAGRGRGKPEVGQLNRGREGSVKNEFGAKLRDGRVQIGEQAEQSTRVEAELGLVKKRKGRQVELRQSKGHEHRLDTETVRGAHAKTERVHREIPQKPVGPGATSAQPGVEAASTPVEGAGEPRAELRSEGQTPTRAASGAPASSEAREQVAKLAHKLIDRAHIGTDTAGRQIMLLDLEVPGRGNIRVRLRRRGDSFELRMRPQNDDLARELRQERELFRESAAERGVNFSAIEIV